MNLIINSSPVHEQSIGIHLAQQLAESLGGPNHMIGLYEKQEGYFNYQFHDQWIDQVVNAERIIIPVAMWNMGIPAALKDFLDKISKRGKLWDFDQDGRTVGLLKDRRVYVLMTSGFEYELNHPHDFVGPYLKAVWASFGILDVRVFRFGGIRRSQDLINDREFVARAVNTILTE